MSKEMTEADWQAVARILYAVHQRRAAKEATEAKGRDKRRRPAKFEKPAGAEAQG